MHIYSGTTIIKSYQFKLFKDMSKQGLIEKYINEAIRIANNSTIGYKSGGSSDKEGYDCSGFVVHCLNHAGICVPRFGTEGMDKHMRAAGFERLDYLGRSKLKRGDILKQPGHTAIYIGDGYNMVDAVGTEYDGKPIKLVDQILIHELKESNKFDFVYRLK